MKITDGNKQSFISYSSLPVMISYHNANGFRSSENETNEESLANTIDSIEANAIEDIGILVETWIPNNVNLNTTDAHKFGYVKTHTTDENIKL